MIRNLSRKTLAKRPKPSGISGPLVSNSTNYVYFIVWIKISEQDVWVLLASSTTVYVECCPHDRLLIVRYSCDLNYLLIIGRVYGFPKSSSGGTLLLRSWCYLRRDGDVFKSNCQCVFRMFSLARFSSWLWIHFHLFIISLILLSFCRVRNVDNLPRPMYSTGILSGFWRSPDTNKYGRYYF